MKVITVALASVLLVSGVPSYSQDYWDRPESVSYDPTYNRFLVSNYDSGNIVAVDQDFNPSEWYTGLVHGYGCQVAGDRLYISIANDQVVGINLDTRQIEWTLTIPSVNNVDGITWDGGNFLYIVDTYGRILKADIAAQSYDVLVTGLNNGIQDIVYDGAHNRLLVAAYFADNSVLAIDLTSLAVTSAMSDDPGYLDGICMNDDGSVFLSSHALGGIVWRWDGGYDSPRAPVATSLNQPAGCCYNNTADVLAVTCFGGDSVAFVNFGDPDQDGIPWLMDNCPETFNPMQEDYDEDGIGDSCDVCTDSDQDGFGDPDFPANTCALDNCPDDWNADQFDLDQDNVGDECDNCLWVYNPDQLDLNGNDIGDACEGCCQGRVGDANGQGGDEPTISDISTMIDSKFITGTCVDKIDCLAEADVNQSGGYYLTCDDVTISDISSLIDYLFITGPETATLPDCP